MENTNVNATANATANDIAIATTKKTTDVISANVNKGVTEALKALGYDTMETSDFKYTFEKEVDGEKQKSEIVVRDKTERATIKDIYSILNVLSYSIPKQCVTFAFWKKSKTWENEGFKSFSEYAKMIVKGKYDNNTINKYTAIGTYFFKEITAENKEIVFVDERLKGVSVSNLDIIASTFKAYADSIEIDGCEEYRDYVSSFLDKFCTPVLNEDGTEKESAKLHLKATGVKLREEVQKLKGNTGKKKDDKKNDKKTTDEKTLSPIDELFNACMRYHTEAKKDNTLDTIVGKVIAYIQKGETGLTEASETTKTPEATKTTEA